MDPELPEPTEPTEPTEEYMPGAANGRHFMARLCRVGDGPWSIDRIHVEGLAPLSGPIQTWATREEAVAAAEKLVAALAH